MTPKEIQAELKAIKATVGSKADVIADISAGTWNKKAISARIYPNGVATQPRLSFDADDWPELFVAMRAKWAECSDRVRAETIRKMALAIIRITADHGACTDAALRQEFPHEDVARYADDAVTDANAIAANGPFAILSLGGANNLAAE